MVLGVGGLLFFFFYYSPWGASEGRNTWPQSSAATLLTLLCVCQRRRERSVATVEVGGAEASESFVWRRAAGVVGWGDSLSLHALATEGLGSTNLWPSTFFL